MTAASQPQARAAFHRDTNSPLYVSAEEVSSQNTLRREAFFRFQTALLRLMCVVLSMRLSTGNGRGKYRASLTMCYTLLKCEMLPEAQCSADTPSCPGLTPPLFCGGSGKGMAAVGIRSSRSFLSDVVVLLHGSKRWTAQRCHESGRHLPSLAVGGKPTGHNGVLVAEGGGG